MTGAADPRTVAAVSELMLAVAAFVGEPVDELEFTICKPRDYAKFAVESVMPGPLGECERSGCAEAAIDLNDEGEALCEDHLYEYLTSCLEQ